MTDAQKIEALQKFRRGETDTLPKERSLNATEAYDNLKDDIASRIRDIQANLNKMYETFDGKNWGSIGDLNYINNMLLEVQQTIG